MNTQENAVKNGWVGKNKMLLLEIGVVSACFLLAFQGVLTQLVDTWYNNEDYSHGFLIAPISAVILWTRREELANTPIESGGRGGLILLGVALLLFVSGTFAEVFTLAALSMIIALVAITLHCFGPRILKLSVFPLFFLLFMIPIPSQIYSSLTLPLQLLVSMISVAVLDPLGIPIYRDGNILHLPNTTMQVVQACSGLRSMISLSALSALFALTVTGIPQRVLVFLAAVPISIIVNAFRVSVTAWLSYVYSPEAAEGTIHELLGIAVFILSLLLLYCWKITLRRISTWAKPKPVS